MCDLGIGLAVAGAVVGAGVGGLASKKHGGNFLTGALIGGVIGGASTYMTAITVGALAGSGMAGTIGTIAGAGIGGTVGAYAASWNARMLAAPKEAMIKAQKQEEQALKKLEENQGKVEVNKTASMVNSNRINRTLSSLRVSMLPQAQSNETLLNNVYGVDSNNVVSATQNMTGLNISI